MNPTARRPIVLDPSPLSEPGLFEPDELTTLVTEIVDGTATLLEEIAAHLNAAQLVDVRAAAHRARNNALSVGASAFADALLPLESAARDGDLERARSAAAELEPVWEPTRAAILRLVPGAGSG